MPRPGPGHQGTRAPGHQDIRAPPGQARRRTALPRSLDGRLNRQAADRSSSPATRRPGWLLAGSISSHRRLSSNLLSVTLPALRLPRLCLLADRALWRLWLPSISKVGEEQEGEGRVETREGGRQPVLDRLVREKVARVHITSEHG